MYRIGCFFLLLLILSFIFLFIGFIVFPRNIPDITGLSYANFVSNLYPFTETSIQETIQKTVTFIFPCFVGILSGVNNIEILTNTLKSIPNGTIGAIVFSCILYIFLICLFGAVTSKEELASDLGIAVNLTYPSKFTGVACVYFLGVGNLIILVINTKTNIIQVHLFSVF